MRIVVFEDELWKNFAPLTHTKHVSELFWGTRRLLDNILNPTNTGSVSLLGRSYLADVARERTGLRYNDIPDEEVLLVNGRIRPNQSLPRTLSLEKKTVLLSGGDLVVARIQGSALAELTKGGTLTAKDIRRVAKASKVRRGGTGELFHDYWELLQTNGFAIVSQARDRTELTAPPELSMIKGPPSNLLLSERAEVEKLVSLDASRGPIVVEHDAVIESFSSISGPCYVGPKTRIRSALLRSGTSICEGSRVGGEVENSIIMANTNKEHLGYVGDTIVGEWVNLGAGSTFSNLKNTYGTIKVQRGAERVDTQMMKLGSVVGDMAKLSIGAMVFAGKRIGLSSHLVGLVTKDVPSFTYHNGNSGSSVEVRLESAIMTQRRMMDRRGLGLSKAQERLIRFLHRATAPERRKGKVKKGLMS